MDFSAALTAGSIFNVTFALEGSINLVGLGFTATVHLFCWGNSPEEAEDVGRAYLMANGIEPSRVSSPTRLAQRQVPASYTFPEQIHGLPREFVEAALHEKPISEAVRSESLGRLAANESRLATGRLLLLQRRAMH